MKIRLNKVFTSLNFFLILFLVFSVFSYTAIAQDEFPNETTGFTYSTDPIKAPPYKVGVSNFSVLNSWRVQMIAEINAEAKRQGDLIEAIYITNSNESLPKQISDFEDLIAKGCDIIIIDPMSSTGLLPVIEKAHELGIIVVDFDSNINTENISGHILVDNGEFGKVGAEYIVEKLNGKGKIIVLNGIKGAGIDQIREQGAMNVFEQYPDIEILGKAWAHWDYAQGKRATEDFLAAHPQIDGVWSQGGAMTQGAMEAFVEAGRPLVPMAGEDNNGYLKLWKEYQSQGFSGYSASMPTYTGATALGLALNIIQGRPYHKYTKIPIPTFGDELLDEYLKPDLPDSYWANTRLSDEAAKEMFAR